MSEGEEVQERVQDVKGVEYRTFQSRFTDSLGYYW